MHSSPCDGWLCGSLWDSSKDWLRRKYLSKVSNLFPSYDHPLIMKVLQKARVGSNQSSVCFFCLCICKVGKARDQAQLFYVSSISKTDGYQFVIRNPNPSPGLHSTQSFLHSWRHCFLWILYLLWILSLFQSHPEAPRWFWMKWSPTRTN